LTFDERLAYGKRVLKATEEDEVWRATITSRALPGPRTRGVKIVENEMEPEVSAR
jgi:hypothetical protein